MAKKRRMIGDSDAEAHSYGVFFVNKNTADAFRKQHGGELVKSGGAWLVKKEIDYFDEGPIVQAIRKEVEKLKLRLEQPADSKS